MQSIAASNGFTLSQTGKTLLTVQLIPKILQIIGNVSKITVNYLLAVLNGLTSVMTSADEGYLVCHISPQFDVTDNTKIPTQYRNTAENSPQRSAE